MTEKVSEPRWKSAAALAGRLIFAATFLMGLVFKVADIGATAGYIQAAGFPFPLLLAWLAAIFEALLVVAFASGLFFAEASLLAALYVVFLGFTFHRASHWGADQLGQLEFGAFVSHFPFAAGLLFAAAFGPGRWAIKKGWIGRESAGLA